MTKISFEEFHSVKRRERANLEAQKDIDKALSSLHASKRQSVRPTIVESPTVHSLPIFELVNMYSITIGNIVEKLEVQIMMTILIWLEMILLTIQIILNDGDCNFNDNVQFLLQRVVSSFLDFSQTTFCVELTMLIIAFGAKAVVMHIGYTIDVAVISLGIYVRLVSIDEEGALTGWLKYIRFLGFFRVWRLARLFVSALSSVEKKLVEVNAEVKNQSLEIQILKKEQSLTESRLKLETDAKARVEKMLRAYKDEAETLTEALNLAAIDVAAAMASGSGLMAEEEDNNKYVDDDGESFYDNNEQNDSNEESILLSNNENESK